MLTDRPFNAGGLFQVFSEEVRQFVERNQVHPVIEVHMSSLGHPVQFLGFGRPPVGVFAEFP